MMAPLTGQIYLNGNWLNANGSDFDSTDPFRSTPFWHGAFASLEQVDEAFQSAKNAFPKWSRVDLSERIAIARRFAESLNNDIDAFSELIARETGKPLWEARSEVQTCIGKVQNSIDALYQRRWTVTESLGGQCTVTRFHPLGVMLVLGPFNLPAHLPGAHIVPALLAGNVIVFKPSEQTPAVGEYLVRAWESAGLPAGVLNLVHGAAEVAQQAIGNDACDGVLFTGSYRVGAAIHRMLAGKPEKMLALEMGGNNALVFESCESIPAAVYQIILSAYITSGQRCTCARRLILIESQQSSELVAFLQQAIHRIAVGDPFGQPQPFLGSLISSQAAASILEGQHQLIEQGFSPLVPCRIKTESPAVVTPGLLESGNQSPDDCELFGPLLTIQYATNFEDAVDLANQSRYGLSAGLISRYPNLWQKFEQLIQAGIVNWNRHTTGASGRLPFGGIGWSGNHRPSGFFASDYCSYPVASMESQELSLPETLLPGLANILG